MDLFKKLLDDLCRHDSDYHYEKLDDLGEIYQNGDILPVALIDYNKTQNVYYVKFRLGLHANKVAKLSSALSLSLQAFVFEDDFLIHEEYGYLYGDDARKAFVQRIQSNYQKEDELEVALNSAFYICHQPIFAFGSGKRGKTKIEKLLNFDLEDEE